MTVDGHPESPWKPAKDRRLERDVKRDAVLRTAAQLFNEKGFHATSLDEVAEQLHVTKPTLYYYVKNKEEILFECVNKGLLLLQEGIAASRRAGGSALDQLLACMSTYARIVTMDFGMCLIRIGEDPLQPESRRRLRRLKAEIDLEFRRLIEAGIREGSLAPCDPKIAAFTVAGGLSWIGRWYRRDGPYTAEQISRMSTDILLAGLATRTDAPARRAQTGKARARAPASS